MCIFGVSGIWYQYAAVGVWAWRGGIDASIGVPTTKFGNEMVTAYEGNFAVVIDSIRSLLSGNTDECGLEGVHWAAIDRTWPDTVKNKICRSGSTVDVAFGETSSWKVSTPLTIL